MTIRRHSVRSVIGVLAILAGQLTSIQAVHAGPGPGPGGGGPGPAPTCQANPGSFGSDLGTSLNVGFQADLPGGTDSISASTPLASNPTWTFLLSNGSTSPVSNPTITVSSGYPASTFGGSIPTAGLPTSCGLPSLGPAQILFFPQMQAPAVRQTSTSGFDATRSASPAVIPPGGGQQTVTVTVTLRDARYAPGNNFAVSIATTSNDTILSTVEPANLDQGETLGHAPGQTGWNIQMAVVGKTYAFSAVVNYANPYPDPWTHSPDVDVTTATFSGACGVCGAVSQSITVPVPSLDGGTPGAGSVRFAVDEATHAWTSGVSNIAFVRFSGRLGDVNAVEGPHYDGTLPASADALSASQTVSGFKDWTFALKNGGGPLVTNPAISVNSGYAASNFTVGNQDTPLAAFPYVTSSAVTLGPGQDLTAPHMSARDHLLVSYQSGYDGTRSVYPLVVGASGQVQTVSFMVKSVDPGITGWELILTDNIQGVNVLSLTSPTNLDQGEQLFGSAPGFGFANWALFGVVPGKEYRFSATIHVPNPFGVPFNHKPEIAMFGVSTLPGGCVACLTGASATIPDASLDGPTAGAGSASYSVSGPLVTWNLHRELSRVVRYGMLGYSAVVHLAPAVAAPGAATVVSARLVTFDRGVPHPIAGESVALQLGSASCSGVSAADGSVSCSLVAPATVGQYQLTASFAGNESLYPSHRSVSVFVAEPTNFVIWGGNASPLAVGATYQFSGDGWSHQVTGGDYAGGKQFMGLACSVAGSSWTTRSDGLGVSAQCKPPDSLDSLISVIVASHVTDHPTSGNVAEHAVLRLAPCPGAALGAAVYGADRPSCGVLLTTYR